MGSMPMNWRRADIVLVHKDKEIYEVGKDRQNIFANLSSTLHVSEIAKMLLMRAE